MLKAIENELEELFGCSMLNWCCNMNNVYAEDKPEPHVHILEFEKGNIINLVEE